jgi:hypothetical protein
MVGTGAGFSAGCASAAALVEDDDGCGGVGAVGVSFAMLAGE